MERDLFPQMYGGLRKADMGSPPERKKGTSWGTRQAPRPHTTPSSSRPTMWDNPLRDRYGHGAPPDNHMLNELEFAYTPVRDKVRDLREYL